MWLQEVEDVKEEVVSHFTAKFTECVWERLVLDGVHFNQISVEDNVLLQAKFSVEEIKEAVWDCDGNKKPKTGRV